MTSPHSLVDADGAQMDANPLDGRGMRVKRLLFDWSSVVAIALACMTYAALSSDVKAASKEIERLRASNDQRAQSDIVIAATMATKSDVQRVSDQVQALASEIRNARAVR